MRIFPIIFLALALLGCRGHMEIAIPADGTEPAKVVTATFWGKGCAAWLKDSSGTLVLAEQDGASRNLTAFLRTLVGAAGSVFGASDPAGDGDEIAAGDGCRALTDLFE